MEGEGGGGGGGGGGGAILVRAVQTEKEQLEYEKGHDVIWRTFDAMQLVSLARSLAPSPNPSAGLD